jgi:UDP-glucuronate 4-epimerase
MAQERVLVTGAAGFIGFHVARRLLQDGYPVVGVDNLDSYYDVNLKEARCAELANFPAFRFVKLDLGDRAVTNAFFAQEQFEYVVHLAAQAGVRYSIVNPYAYLNSNYIGFLNVLEGCRERGCRHLVYASSSSVYGANTRVPFKTSDHVDHPLNLYAASKKANELMAHAYANLYRLPVTGLRFFTVYGPWGRPDMAYWIFADAILTGKPIKLYNNGRMRRDFTYIDDVVEAVVRLIPKPAASNPTWSSDAPDPASSSAPAHVYNVGNSEPVEIIELVQLIEREIDKPAKRELLPMQPGEALETYADATDLQRAVGFRPNTPLAEGIGRFIDWFVDYNK